MPAPLEVDPQEVKQRIDSGEKLHLIDVREPHEFALAKIEGATLIPMRAHRAPWNRRCAAKLLNPFE